MSAQPESNDSFTAEGYNDKPKECPEEGCGGTVEPTYNANVGECSKCHQRYNWSEFS